MAGRPTEQNDPRSAGTRAAVAAFRLHGRVQGVGFRWWTRQEALRRGLAGTVRNARDGSVEVRVSGDATAVEEFRRILAEGPPGARVDTVEALPVPEESSSVGFHIIR